MRNNAIGATPIAAILNFEESPGVTMEGMKRGF
jgi:hypothetical protein